MLSIDKHSRLILASLLLLTSLIGYAQSYDFPSMEALITDHKQVRSMMITRNMMEHANELLHQKSAETNTTYKAINDSLDKYTRYFEMIDLIYTSCATIFNIKNTYDDLSSRVSDFATLNERYLRFCVEKKSVTASDTIILNCYVRIVDSVQSDMSGLYTSLADLVAYATGAATCTTAHLMYIFTNINNYLDHLRAVIKKEYYILWKYMRIRMTFWKPSLYKYKKKDRETILNESLRRWHEARKASLTGSLPTNNKL